MKTLKDLELYLPDSKKVKGMSEECVSRHDLKELVIKQIKYEKEYHNKFRDARADILIELFNIQDFELNDTEEKDE